MVGTRTRSRKPGTANAEPGTGTRSRAWPEGQPGNRGSPPEDLSPPKGQPGTGNRGPALALGATGNPVSGRAVSGLRFAVCRIRSAVSGARCPAFSAPASGPPESWLPQERRPSFLGRQICRPVRQGRGMGSGAPPRGNHSRPLSLFPYGSLLRGLLRRPRGTGMKQQRFRLVPAVLLDIIMRRQHAVISWSFDMCWFWLPFAHLK